MQDLIITTKDQLQTLVIDAVNACLDFRPQRNEQQSSKEIINREELCKRLDLNEGTIIRYEKKGKIPRLSIGNSIRYNWPAVVEALETGNKKGGRL